MINRVVYDLLGSYAERMKLNPTKAEAQLWADLKARKDKGRWQTQVVKSRYILDFYNSALKLCVEVDGSSHATTKFTDSERDRYLFGRYGIRTFRIPNQNVYDGNLDRLDRYIKWVEQVPPIPLRRTRFWSV